MTMPSNPADAIPDATGRKRILFLTPQLPYPPEQGTALRNYNLIAQVAARHDVALLSFAEEGQAEPGPLAEYCHPLRTIPTPERGLRARLLTLLLSRQPDMAERLASPAYGEALRKLVAEEHFDLVQVEGIELAPYALALQAELGERAPAVVFDDHNAEYVLQRRTFETDLGHPARWPAAAYSFIQWQRLRRFERRVCRAADHVLAVSAADARAIEHLVPTLRPTILPNGVDIDRYHPDLPRTLELRHPAVVFTGKMDFRPNIDAVLWFYEHVWPRVCAQLPEAHFYVVGKSPHPRLGHLSTDPSVTVTGYVADPLPFFAGADLYVVPLRIGGGTRLKVLEAMAAGLPIVSTTLGVEGVELDGSVHAVLADTPESFAAATIELLQDPDRRQALGAAARAQALRLYDWRRLVPLLEDVYARL